MDAMTQVEVFVLISELNAFADRSEAAINRCRNAYEQNKQAINARANQTLSQLEASYKSNCDAINGKSKQTLGEARKILAEVENLDARLVRADKYYLKTKDKKEMELAGTTSNQYDEATDYFTILENIRSQYLVISQKYSRDILPKLVNGINYLFSSKRKQDYEDLIILLNTIRSYVAEIEEELPPLISDSLAEQKEVYFAKRKDIIAGTQRNLGALEQNYQAALDDVAGQICEDLDQVLPDERVTELAGQIALYESNRNRVNAGSGLRGNLLYMCFVDYPVDYFVQSPVVSALIKDKCQPLLAGESVRFPIAFTGTDAPPWMVTADVSQAANVKAFSHALLYGFLASCPVAKLTCSVFDPENRGTSISPFFEAKKKLPDLFGEKTYISREEVAERIQEVNLLVEDVLQNRLGTEFDTVYDYAEANPDYSVNPQLLLVYDFPRGFDEQSLTGFRNILRYGSRCGIYTLILTSPDNELNGRPDDYARGLKAIDGLTSLIRYDQGAFAMRGMPLQYHPMPERGEFNKFFGKYMLLYEGIKNRGIAFSPLIKKLVDTKDSVQLEDHIAFIRQMMGEYEQKYFTIPSTDAGFPDNITLGTVLYPAEVFSDSPNFDKIRKAFSEDEGITLLNQLKLPLNLDLNNAFNVLLDSPEQSAEEIRTFTHHIMWSLLSFLPVTKVNFKVVDVENRNSTRPFSDLRKALPEMFTLVTSQDKVYELLQEINRQIDDFTQNKLGSRYENLLEYNRNTPKRAEAVTVLLLYDFPRGLDARSVDLLISILRNGGRCGIYTIICHDPAIQLSRYESLDERLEQMQKYSISAEYRDGTYYLLPFGLPVSIMPAKDMTEISRFTAEYAEAANVIKHKAIAFEDILPEDLYEGKASRILDIPIGIGDEDAVVSLVFGEGTSHHCLIGGGTGGGKSTLLHTIIMSGMMKYSPDELQLYMMDFKGGTEFKVYESERLPHIRLLALDAMQEFGESILENLVQEMEKRQAVFKEAGGYTKLQDYVSGTGKPMPRILIIMDEFQILFNDSTNRKVAVNCANLAKRIVTEGRAYGLHLVMATQSTNIISSLTLDRGTIEQMRIRMGLKCGDADTRYLFSDLYSTDAKTKMMGPKGTAVLNEDYTESPENNDTSLQLGNIALRVAFCDDASKERYLREISRQFREYPCDTQIFEGSRTEKLLDYLDKNDMGYTDEVPVAVDMGAKIKVAPPFKLMLDRRRKHNLVICGSSIPMMDNLVGDYLVSAALNQNTSLYVIDGETMIGEGTCDDLYEALAKNTGRLSYASSRADIVRFIHDIYEEYTLRKKHGSKNIICTVIKNLQYLDLVKAMFRGERIEESEYLDTEEEPAVQEAVPEPAPEPEPDPNDIFAAFNAVVAARSARRASASSPAPAASSSRKAEGYTNEKLLKLIDDGSAFGIHFVVASTDYNTVKETMRFGENILSRFPERIVFSLSDNDAVNLVEGVSVSGLASNLVYYTDGIRDTFQLKPYIAPKAEELKEFWKEIK